MIDSAGHLVKLGLPRVTLGVALSISMPFASPAWSKDASVIGAEQRSAGDTTAASEGFEANPIALIEAMSDALNSLNYEGVFVHAQGLNLTSMHILHSSNQSVEMERLRALDGEAREVIRNNTLVTCIWPNTQSVVVSKSKPRDLLPRLDASFVNHDRYVFSLRGKDRVAGRNTHVVDVKPRDEFRYGYRFWIDTITSMLLRSMLFDGPDNPVEQIIFTDIDYPAEIEPSRFNFADSDSKLSWLEPNRSRATSGLRKIIQESADRVQFAELPMGYREISETFSSTPIKDGPVSHVMLSDGMSSVSVYVEYVTAAEQSGSGLGHSRMGAVNAYGIGTQSALITAVGEVPVATVKAIAYAVVLSE